MDVDERNMDVRVAVGCGTVVAVVVAAASMETYGWRVRLFVLAWSAVAWFVSDRLFRPRR